MVKHIYPKITLAEEIYQKLDNPTSAEWYADALIEGGALIKAEAPLIAALSEHSSNVRLLQKLASVYLKQRKWTNAADTLRKALTIAPSDFMLHVRLSQALTEAGEFQAAYNSIQRALEISPNHGDAETIAQNISLRLRKNEPAIASPGRKSFWKRLFLIN
jgi:tetratricopeptide (TPR) repeat protein